MVNYQALFSQKKNHFKTKLRDETINERRRKLKSLKNWIKANELSIQEAIYADFKKPSAEVALAEIKPVLLEIEDALLHLKEWTNPKSVGTPLFLMGTKSKIIYEPKGVVLIIAPWNYPFNLCIGPLVSAIAAGCAIVVKPSEVTPNTEQLIKRLIAEVFDENEISVVTGGAEVGAELIKLPWNHIFFTGSPQVGKIVMKAAAENLTSVTLELGGKNPVVVDDTASVKDTAEKLIWGKFFNCGQTCISPNYVMIHESKYSEFKKAIVKAKKKLYGESDIVKNPDYPRIVNARHCERVADLLSKAIAYGDKVLSGGKVDLNENYIEPTIIEVKDKNSPLFETEIFGPLMPIFSYSNLNEAIDFINEEHPALSLYVFSKSRKNSDKIIQNTMAGTTVINDTTLQFSHPELPFGGHNNSGIGKAHGHFGFLEFSNQRAVMKQTVGPTGAKMIYPPYTGFKKKMVKIITWRV